jgi:Co/Zn/Cd efflux system component
MGLWVAGSTLYQLLVFGVPQAEVMSIIGVAALAANLISVWLLMAYKDGDSNVRSVWLCSRNDAIGNVAVVIAAGFVWWLNSGVPDLIVAGAMSLLFLNSSQQILRQSYGEWRDARSGRGHVHHDDQCCDHDHGHEHHH